MKRFIAIVLSALMLCSFCIFASADTGSAIKVSTGKYITVTESGDILTVSGVTVAEILGSNAYKYKVIDYTGREVSVYSYAATGMKIIAEDFYGDVLETKAISVLGDINGDGRVTAADSRRVLRASVELEKLNPWQTTAADVICDKEADAGDARIILRASVELENILKIFDTNNK